MQQCQYISDKQNTIIEQKTQEILRLENELHTQTIIADQFEKEYIKCRSELGHLKQK